MDDFNQQLDGTLSQLKAKSASSDEMQTVANGLLSAHTQNLKATSQQLYGNLTTQPMSNDDFVSGLGTLSQNALALGADPATVRSNASQLYGQRIDKSSGPQDIGDTVLNDVAKPFEQAGLTTAGAALALTGDASETLGGFLGKWFPKAGAAVSSFGDTLKQGVSNTMEGGTDMGYNSKVTPWGSSAYVLKKAGVIGQNEAIARGAIEAMGGTAQIAAYLAPEVGLGDLAAGMGLAKGAEDVGKGETNQQALSEGALTTGATLAFGIGTGVLANGASSILNKVLKTEVGRTLLTGAGALTKRISDLAGSGAPTDAVQSEMDDMTDKLGIAKAGVVANTLDAVQKPEVPYFDNMNNEIRQGSTAAYAQKSSQFGKVFNKGISLAGDDLSNVSSSIENETGNLGFKDGEDLVSKYQSAVKTMTGAGYRLDPEVAAANSGLSSDEAKVAQAQLDQAPEDVQSRSAFSNWVGKLQTVVDRPQGATTEALQSYLNPPSFTGKYDAVATRISNALRSDLESKFSDLGMSGDYAKAIQLQKQIPEQVDTNLRDTAFNASTQDEFERQVVSGEVKPKDPAVAGLTGMMSPQTKSNMQAGLVNEVQRQVQNEIDLAASSGNPDDMEQGYKNGSSIINKFVNNYGGTDFLSNQDRTNLLLAKDLLTRDFTAPGSGIVKGTASIADDVAPGTQEAADAGKGVAASQTIQKQLISGNTGAVGDTYFKLPDNQKSDLWASMQSPEAKAQLGSLILQGKTGNALETFSANEDTSKDGITSALGGVVKSFEDIKNDTPLWENGLSDQQRSTIDDANDSFQTLDSLEGNKYKKAAIRIATAPILAAAGHPIAGTLGILEGAKGIIESMFNNMGDITPSELDRYDRIMQGSGDDSNLYKMFRSIRDIVDTPASMFSRKGINPAVRIANTVAGQVAGDQISKDNQ